MHPVRRFMGILVLAIGISSAFPLSNATAQGRIIDRFMVKGYDHGITFGPDPIFGALDQPFGVCHVTQIAPQGGKPAGPRIIAFVDAYAFTGPTTAIEVFGIAEAAGTVAPPSTSFAGQGRVNIALEAIALFYELNSLTGRYDIVGADFGTIDLKTAAWSPTDIDNVRERSTYQSRDGLSGHGISYRTDLRGRFGYGVSGTVGISFNGSFVSGVVVPDGTPIQSDLSRIGFIQSGSVTTQK